MVLKISINVDALAAQCKEFAEEARQDLIKKVSMLAAYTHVKVLEMAESELKEKSFQKKFMDSVHFEELATGVWSISIAEEGLFVEEGISPNTPMATDKWLLKNAETNKKGEKYKIIPFEWSQARGQMSTTAKGYVDELKKMLRDQRIPFKKLEMNAQGSPRIGTLHDINFGGEKPGRGNTPIFDRVRIYQTQTENKKTGKMKYERQIVTFRTVKDPAGNETDPKKRAKLQAAGLQWRHPGLEKKQFLEKAEEWAMKEWEDKMLPEVFKKWNE